MKLPTQRYEEQKPIWPLEGRHILACYDEETIIVYQAYKEPIADYALANGTFGGKFSYSRMSWIKPGFLWMMYRSGWGTKEDQEKVLALRLRRPFFDSLLSQAVPSTYWSHWYDSREKWQVAVSQSQVRLQWDPDHSPSGEKLERRAIQLGLRGAVLRDYGKREIVEVIDMTAFVNGERERASGSQRAHLVIPIERPYLPSDKEVAERLGLLSSSTR